MELAVEFEKQEMPEEADALRAKAQKVESQLQRMRTQFQKRWGDPRPDAPAGSERAKKRDWDEIRVLKIKLTKNATDIANAQREKQGRRVALLNLAREMIEKELGEKSAAYRVRYNQSPTSSQGPAVPPRTDGPVTRSASAAARSEDIGGGAYSGGLDRDDGRGDGEAVSGKSIPNLEEDVQRLRERVREWEQLIQKARDEHLPQAIVDQKILGRDRAKAELEAARARSKGKGLAVPEEVAAHPGPSRLSPYPDEEEEDVLQALTSLSARAPDRSSSSGQTTSAGGPKAGGTRAGVSPLDMKVADTLARMAADPSSARRSAMSDAVSDAGSGAGGSGARLEGSGKRQSTGGGEEGTGDSTAESGPSEPRRENEWSKYLTDLKNAQDKAVASTEMAKGDRSYMERAREDTEALWGKRDEAPSDVRERRSRGEPGSLSVDTTEYLAVACEQVIKLLRILSPTDRNVESVSREMVRAHKTAREAVMEELQKVRGEVRENHARTLIPTPPRPDLVQSGRVASEPERIPTGNTRDEERARTRYPPAISEGSSDRAWYEEKRSSGAGGVPLRNESRALVGQNGSPQVPTPESSVRAGNSDAVRRSPRLLERAEVEAGPSKPIITRFMFVPKGSDLDKLRAENPGVAIGELSESSSLEPTNKTYNPDVMEGVDAPFPFKVPNSVHQILYKRHTIGDGDCLFYAISLIRAFRRGEKINEEGLEGKAEWLRKSLLDNLTKFVKDAKEKKMVFEYKNEKEIRNILQTPKKWANTDVAALAARFLRNDITIIGREKGNPRTKETKRKYDDMATGIPSAPATVADAVRLSWLSRFPGQTGAPTQEEAKKGK
eukprot:jgi/Mesvir1/12968/Mv05980-RA.1